MNFLRGWGTTTDPTRVETNIDSKIRALAFLPDGRPLIVSCEESTVQLRDLDNDLVGEPIESKTGVLAVAASKDGARIVTGATDGLTIWNMGGKDPVKMVHHAINGVRTIDISSDSKWAVTGSDAWTVDVWDISTGERHAGLGPLRHEYNVVAVKFCLCGRRIATATLFGSIRVYATTSGQKLLTIPAMVMSTLSAPNITLAWFADPRRPQLFAVSEGQIKCLDSKDGSVIIQWPLRGVSHPSSIALSPNSKVIAYSLNKTIVLRDTITGQQIGDTLKHDGEVSCIAFSPGNDRLAAGAGTKFTIWDLQKLFTDTSYFLDSTVEYAELCAHYKQDTVQELPPSTFLLPLMSISNGAVKPWLHGYLDSAEEVLSKEIEDPTFVPNHDVLANRALLRGRSGKGSMALEDAKQSLLIQTSAIGQIAITMAIIHQGKYELARQEIPKVLETGHSDEHTFLLGVIQSILSCLSGEYDREISHINALGEDQKLLFLVQANMHLSREKFEAAMQSWKKARVPTMFPYDETPEMRTISFIFGWKFNGLGIQIQQRKCEFLLGRGDSEAAVLFLKVKDTYQREIATHADLSTWALEFRKQCLKELEDLGDKALNSGNYIEAIKQYKAIEPLIGVPDLRHALLLKRSKAHAEIGLTNWSYALEDADEAIRLNPTSPWGFDRRHEALYLHQDYHEAAEALDEMIILLADSKDDRSKELREKGVEPRQRRKIIHEVVEDTLAQPRPHILISTKSGRLCDKQKQTEVFRADRKYKDLVLSPTSLVRAGGIDWQEIIQQYFCYSTFSHTWEDKGEPEFREVEKISVEELTESFPHKKLQTFCKKSDKYGYRWAWSDTCCINKAEKEVLDVSLRSMYRWYSDSSLTIVHLKGVHDQLKVDFDVLLNILDQLLQDFVKCRWNKRAWTLQEYFASKVIHFYTEDWKPYLPIVDTTNLTSTNHKDHHAIQRGMELVTGLNEDRLATLKPGSDDAREKLRLASERKATRREDVAYSLLGIFKVTIEAIYGDDEVPRALGRLLGALLTQSADVTILAWTGQPSEYNTCLPTEITVYQQPESLHVPQPFKDAQLAPSVSIIVSNLLSSAIKLHDRLLDLPPPELHYGRLKLPCICFPLSSISQVQNSYTATVPLLGEVTLKPAEDLSSSRSMVLVHPWFKRLLDPGISLLDSARRKSASRLLAALRQPFGALLLVLNQSSQDYRRIAADQLIKVQIREDVSPDQLLENIRVLYIR